LNDKSLGSVILALGVIGAIVYTYWFLAPAKENDPLFYVPTLGVRWALALPILLGVLALFFLAIWIGWTMAVTPPPIPKEEEKSQG
jgi:hypothetical protein